MTHRLYGKSYHANRNQHTRYAAETVLKLVFAKHEINSVCDIGCGVGTWLDTAQRLGARHIQGFDGAWVDKAALVIDQSHFQECDLNERLSDPIEKFDLAISLEVAEHLRPERAEYLVDDYCRLSDLVLFSAAIPGQGGTGHIHERWQSYWAGLFEKRGYRPVDMIRPLTWQDPKIAWWYRQNMVLYVRQGSPADHSFSEVITAPDTYLDIVHPEQFEAVTNALIRRGLRKIVNRLQGR